MYIEAALEPDLPICDPHHHLWDREQIVSAFVRDEALARYLLPDLLADLGQGHNIVSTVFVEAGAFYRATGPTDFMSVGEIEFVNGVAAMCASGRYGATRICAGIVGNAPLDGERVDAVLDALVAAGNGRLRGIRNAAANDPDPALEIYSVNRPAGLLGSDAFRAGFARLARHGLSFDAFVYHPQLVELIDLARAFPDQPIILDQVGTPLGLGRYADQREAVFAAWRRDIEELARCPNVRVKLGGLAMSVCNFGFNALDVLPSERIAALWKPYIDVCISAFGPERSMFESNFPVDAYSCSYGVLWNALKRIASGCSAAEKARLFHDTASETYRLNA